MYIERIGGHPPKKDETKQKRRKRGRKENQHTPRYQ
jgi:hypothetical protein